jgi:molybdopterin-containing oxidoreductase family iron-sulfur binding subunit
VRTVQRINSALLPGRPSGPGRRGRDGCAQACPAAAIVFGDINDKTSRVAAQKADARNYSLLGDLNTRPRTTYLASIRNPNPPGAHGAAAHPAQHGKESET